MPGVYKDDSWPGGKATTIPPGIGGSGADTFLTSILGLPASVESRPEDTFSQSRVGGAKMGS
jgi:hypothetical protein